MKKETKNSFISMPKTKHIDNQAVTTLKNALSDHALSKQEYIRVQAALMKKQGFTVDQIMQRRMGKTALPLRDGLPISTKKAFRD